MVVNVPVILIMIGTLLVGVVLKRDLWWAFLIVGFALGWAWWSYTVPRWRRWALRRGAQPARLQRWAVAVGLTWPKGWIFEKTESRIDE